jgi:DNA-dependent RNA polymerase auxiliary subunit epsilon
LIFWALFDRFHFGSSSTPIWRYLRATFKNMTTVTLNDIEVENKESMDLKTPLTRIKTSRRRSNADVLNLSATGRDSARRRVKTKRFDFEFLENEEQRLIQQVRIDMKRKVDWKCCLRLLCFMNERTKTTVSSHKMKYFSYLLFYYCIGSLLLSIISISLSFLLRLTVFPWLHRP